MVLAPANLPQDGTPKLKSENFTALYYVLWCSGRRNERVSWWKPVKSPLRGFSEVADKL